MKRRIMVCSGWLALIGILSAIQMAAAADVPRQPQRWALLIGVNDYASVQDLRYCVADQESLAKQLMTSGFPKDQVYLLDDKAAEQKFRPSKLNIQKQLELVLGMPTAGDTVVLSFSGHGVQLDGKSYLCPADCDLDHPAETMISLDKVFEELSACKASLKLLIVDACRNDVELGGKRSIDGTQNSRGFGKSLETPPEGISLLTSCSPGQFAREHEKLGHGVFMHFILEGLQGQAADDDGSVRLGRLLDYTSLNTQKYVHDEFNAAQRPYYRVEGSGPVELTHIEHARGEKISLKPIYRKGDRRTFVLTSDSSTTVDDGKTKQTERTTANQELRTDVLRSDRSGATWRVAVKRMHIQIDSSDAKQEFDTDHPIKELEATAQAIKGTPITFNVGTDRKIQMDVAAYRAALIKAGGDKRFTSNFADGLAGAFAGNASFSLFTGFNPGKPVGIGDRWQGKDSVTISDVLTESDITFTLLDRREGTAVINADGRVKLTLKQLENAELTGVIRGTIDVDEKNGWITRYDLLSTSGIKKDDKSLTVRTRLTMTAE